MNHGQLCINSSLLLVVGLVGDCFCMLLSVVRCWLLLLSGVRGGCGCGCGTLLLGIRVVICFAVESFASLWFVDAQILLLSSAFPSQLVLHCMSTMW